jgi:Spy/CpxP family protein refolding chaperone
MSEKTGHPMRLLAILSVVSFLSGTAVGVALTVHHLSGQLPFLSSSPGEMPGKIAGHLRHELGLSAEQTAKIEAIFVRGRGRILEMRLKHQPEIERLASDVFAEVNALLTPEQQQAWRAWFDTVEARLKPPAPPAPEEGGASGQ